MTSVGASSIYHLVKKGTSAKGPLLILMHGVGSNELDLFNLGKYFPESWTIVSARGPYVLGPDRFGWYGVDFSTGKPVIDARQAENSRLLIGSWIQELGTWYDFDKTQVYLAGFSQGAIMSLSVGLSFPELVNGILVWSGRLLTEALPVVALPNQLKHLRIFISHGLQDNVLPVSQAQNTLSFLREWGLHPFYKEYTAGHTLNQEMIQDWQAWLLNSK